MISVQKFNTAVSIHWTGLLDWTTGLDYWTGLLDWTTGLDYWTELLDWTTGLDYRTGLLDCILDWTHSNIYMHIQCRTKAKYSYIFT